MVGSCSSPAKMIEIGLDGFDPFFLPEKKVTFEVKGRSFHDHIAKQKSGPLSNNNVGQPGIQPHQVGEPAMMGKTRPCKETWLLVVNKC